MRSKLIEEGTLRQTKLALDIAHNRLCLIHTPLGEEITDRLGHVQAQEEDIERGQCANKERRLPAKDRDEEVGNACRHKPAKPPEALKEHNEASAQPCRRILAHQRRCNGQLAAQAETDKETEHEQRLIVPRNGTEPRRDTIEENRDRKHLLAADAVSNRSRKHRPKRHADQPNRADPSHLRRRETPLARQYRQDKGDQPRIHRIKQPAKPGDNEQLVLESAERQIFQTIQNH